VPRSCGRGRVVCLKTETVAGAWGGRGWDLGGDEGREEVQMVMECLVGPGDDLGYYSNVLGSCSC
jgi:hypothetical protein